MIKQKTPYIHVFKLSSGEEIIASVVDETTSTFEIKNPLMMVMGQRGPQFAPFMIMANPSGKISLYKGLILGEASPAPELESQYEGVISGIVLPKKSSIITS